MSHELVVYLPYMVMKLPIYGIVEDIEILGKCQNHFWIESAKEDNEYIMYPSSYSLIYSN